VSISENIWGRVVVAGVMGSIAFAFIVLLVAATGLPITAGLLVAALAGAGPIAAWLARSAASVRPGWGRGCLVNGLLSAAVAAGFGTQDEFWSGRLVIWKISIERWGRSLILSGRLRRGSGSLP
jgi:hypothetical protein